MIVFAVRSGALGRYLAVAPYPRFWQRSKRGYARGLPCKTHDPMQVLVYSTQLVYLMQTSPVSLYSSR